MAAKAKVFSWTVAAIVGAMACDPTAAGAQATSRTRRLAEIKAKYPCVPVSRVPRRILSKAVTGEACWMVGLAMAEIAEGRATKFGFTAGDTARVDSARVGEMRFRSLDGSPATEYWYAELTIGAKHVEAQIDQRSRKVTLVSEYN